jgi:hypothetical protein
MSARFFFVGAAVFAAVFGSGCNTFGTNRDDLQQAAALHHIDLRWGRLENAAQRVSPDLRGAFLTSWASRLHGIEVQDIEVTGMVLNEAGDAADVIVTMTWVERDTMSVLTTIIPEQWTRVDGTWLASKPAEPPPLPEMR